MLDRLPLNGYKTYIVGIGFLLFGIGGFLTNSMDANEALTTILAGLAAFGIGHKVDKVEKAAKNKS